MASVDDVLAKLDAALARGLAHDVAALAVFDADHTLWNQDLGRRAFEAAPAAGVLKADVVDESVRAFLAERGHPAPASATLDDLVAQLIALEDTRALYDTALARGEDLLEVSAQLYALHAWVYAGQTPAELQTFARSLFERYIDGRTIASAKGLLDGARARGLRCALVSASPAFLLWPAAEAFGFSRDDVWAMAPDEDADGRLLPRVALATQGRGKRTRIRQALEGGACRPLLAAGDSVDSGDRDMLDDAVVAVAVRPRGTHRARALERGYPVLD